MATSTWGQNEEFRNPIKDVGSAVKGIFSLIGRALDTLTDQKSTKLKALFDENKFEEAAAFYTENEKDLSSSDTAKALLPKIATGLNAQLAAGAEQSAARLAALLPPLPVSEWASTRELLNGSRTTLDTYNAQPLLKREALRSPAIDQLSASLSAAELKVMQSASQAFATYNHASAPLFYQEFPVSISTGERTRIAQEQFDVWLAAIAISPESKARSIISAYAEAIKAVDQRERLASAYSSTYRREKGWPASLSLPQILQLGRAVQGVLPETSTSTAKVAIVTLSDSTGSSAKAPLWDTQKTGLTPMQATLSELPRLLPDLISKQGYASVLVAAPTPVSTMESLRSMGMQSSRRITGERQVSNPDYAEAQNQLRKKEQDFQEIEQKNQEIQRSANSLASQASSGMGALGALVGGGLGTYALETARQELETARRKASSTPSMVERQILENYSYPVAKVERIASQQVALYAVEGTKFQRTVLTQREKREATIAYHVDPRDPDKTAIDQRNVQERARLRQLDAINSIITPDQALQALANGTETAPSVPLSALASTVRADGKKYQLDSSEEIARSAEQSARLEKQIAEAAPASPVAPVQQASSPTASPLPQVGACNLGGFDQEFSAFTQSKPQKSNWGMNATYNYSYFLGLEGLKILPKYRSCMSDADFAANYSALVGMRDKGREGCIKTSSTGSCAPNYPN